MDKEKKWMIVKLSLLGASILLLAIVVILFINGLTTPPPAEEFTYPEITEPTPEPTLPPPPANPYYATDFEYKGDYLSLINGASVLGIDVSEHQEEIDWNAVKEAGVEFVMIRVGYRGYESGVLMADECAQVHYEGARAAGLQVGAYFFSQAVSAQEAEQEAVFTLEQIQSWQVDMPVVFDWEYIAGDARTGEIDAESLTHITAVFCQKVEEAGYEPMFYFNQNQGDHLLNLSELVDYDFWLAMYGSMTYPYKVKMWQYTSSGTVPGIPGNVDLNLYFPD